MTLKETIDAINKKLMQMEAKIVDCRHPCQLVTNENDLDGEHFETSTADKQRAKQVFLTRYAALQILQGELDELVSQLP